MSNDSQRDRFHLPDVCTPLAVLVVLLLAELIAICVTLARIPGWPALFPDLARTSLFLAWLALTSSAILCKLRGWLNGMDVARGSAACFALVMLNILVVSEAVYWLGHFYAGAAGSGWFPAEHGFFLGRNLAVGSLLALVGLRYLYVSHQWQRNVRNQAESRIYALQARIRPHFLFNSMNTIAALTRSNPDAAEEAVEDLADLFRASLADPSRMVRVRDELDIVRTYLRMESQRLGERLVVEWDLEGLPQNARVPGLTLQPLVENAIYHGIEQLPGPGVVRIEGRAEDGSAVISVVNPLAENAPARGGGNRLALDNIRQRLALTFGRNGSLATVAADVVFRATLRFPASEEPVPLS